MVHAPQRAAARLRVGLRRRQPAGARLGGDGASTDRPQSHGGRGHRLPGADLPQAADQLHLVGQPQGRAGQQRLRGRLPRARQHRRLRPLQAAARRRRRSSSPTAPPGWRMYCLNMLEIALRARRRTTAPTRTSPSSSSSTSLCIAAAMNGPGPVGRGGRLLLRRPAQPDGHDVPLKVRSMVGLIPLFAVACSMPASLVGRLPNVRSWRTCDWFIGTSGPTPSVGFAQHAATACCQLLCRVDATCAGCSPSACSTRTSSSRPMACARCRAGISSARSSSSRRHRARLDYEPGESTTRAVRRQLELARAGLVPAQLPAHRSARRYRQLLRRRAQGRAPDRRGPQERWTEVAADLPRRLIATASCEARRPPAGPRRQPGCSRRAPRWRRT